MSSDALPAPQDRPRVVMAVGSSVDGKVAPWRGFLWTDPDPGPPARPSAARVEAARQGLIDDLYHPQAVLEGSSSLVRDDAGPRAGLPDPLEPHDELYADHLPTEVTGDPEHRMWFTVVDGRGRVEWDMKGGGGWDVLVLVCRSTPPAYLAYLRRERLCYLVAGDERVDLLLALRRMRDELGVHCVTSKAGGGLNGALLRAGLIDELHLTLSPTAIGGLGTPSVFDGPPLQPGQSPTSLRLLSVHAEADGMVALRYEVLWSEQGR